MDDIVDFMRIYIEDINVLGEVTDEIAMDLENNIKDEAPYDQGRLRRSIRVDTRLYSNYSIVTGYYDEGLAPHGDFVLMGSSMHEIWAKNAKALKTPYGYFKKVVHPGTKPDDFLGRGLDRTMEAYK